MEIVQQVLFILLAGGGIFLFARQLGKIRRNILLGRDEELARNKAQRWRNLLLLALGQKKMFRNPLVALLHLVVYAGFIIINIEIVEILLDGALGRHRLFAPLAPGLYQWLIGCFEILAVLVIVACAVFLVRRNIIKLKRFVSGDLNGWPRSDANYILITEIVLMLLFLTMNSADLALQEMRSAHYDATGDFWISGLFKGLFSNWSEGGLIALERVCWWLHILGILAFMNYLPYSKHLHIILAFPNAYYARQESQGQMLNMPEIQREVLYAMQPELAPAGAPEEAPKKFGARDVTDLGWKNLMDAYSCTECGRCTAACPANITGKSLSPRKIMMDTRDRLEEVGRNIDKHGKFEDDGKALVKDYITEEELRACTTCNACVEECPVSISPLSIILQLRRYLVMEESNAPAEWNAMFSNVENNFAPWKFAPDDRDAWVKEG